MSGFFGGGGGGAWQHLASQAASASAAVDFTEGIDATYPVYKVVCVGIRNATEGTALMLRGSTDGGATFLASGYSYGTAVCNSSGTIVNDKFSSGDTAFYLMNTEMDRTPVTEPGYNGVVTFFNPADSNMTPFIWEGFNTQPSTGSVNATYGGGKMGTAQDTDAIRFLASSGNITSGDFHLFGLKAG